MRTYAAYLRKSRAEEGESLEEVLNRHKIRLKELAKSLNIGIVDWFEEVVSGESVSARPRMQDLLEAVADEQYYAVFCMDIDRLGRGDMQDQGLILSTFRRSETKIITPARTYDLLDEADETMTEFLAFFARQEYKMIRKRMHRGTVACLQEGGYIANAPYGYEQCRINKKPSLRVVPEEARFVHLAFDRYCAGVGATAIADELNALGAIPRRNVKWNKNSVRYMLRNPVYSGLTVYNRNHHVKKGAHGADRHVTRANPQEKWLVAPGLHEAIITEEQFNLAQDIRQGRAQPYTKLQDGTIKHQFAGVFRCSKCGRNLFTLGAAKGGPYMACNTPGCCAMAKERYLEEHIITALTAKLNQLKRQEKNPHIQDELKSIEQTIETKQAKLRRIGIVKANLYSFLEDGTYDRETFKQRMAKAEEEEDALIAELDDALSQKNAALSADKQKLVERLENALSLWPTANQQDRNSLLKSVIADAVYSKEKKTKPMDFSVEITLRSF